MKFSVKKIVYLGLFIGLGVILKLFKIPVPFLGLSFGGFPIILAGVLFGPVSGGVVGAMVDIVGFMIFPKGSYFPHFTLTAALTGFIPGMVMFYFKGREDSLKYWHYLLAIGAGQSLTSILLVPYFLQILFGVPFKIKFYHGLMVQLYHIPLYTFGINILVKRLSQLNIGVKHV